jgi:hypothetical protein
LFFSDDKSARLPRTNPKAPNNIDFPAPVSPVIMEKPEEKLMANLSINAKLFIESDVSMSFV